MAKSKLNLENSNLVWNPERRYKVNEITTHIGKAYQNLTGKNSEPGVGNDWYSIEEEINLVHKTGNETINNVKTFVDSPIVPDAINDNEATNLSQLKIDTGVDSSITTVNFGGIPAGTDIQDRLVTSLLIDAMIAYLYPQFQSQSCNYPSIVEVGTTVSGNGIFAWSISNAGNVKPNTVAIFDINSATNIASGLANDGSETVALNSILLNANNATQSWKIKAQNTKDENFESGNIVVTAKFKRFFGATSATPTTATARSLGSEFQVSNQFILNTGSTLTKFAVCLPSGVTISSVIDLDALNLNITSNYVSLGTININDIGGTSRVYNLYELNIGAPYSSNHRHQITTI